VSSDRLLRVNSRFLGVVVASSEGGGGEDMREREGVEGNTTTRRRMEMRLNGIESLHDTRWPVH
jgi:hypothetical protein